MTADVATDLKYCIRGNANIWGGYIIDLFIDMEEWLAANCRGAYTIVKFDEAKFSNRFDAIAFARKWFEAGRWQLHFMDTGCTIAACAPRLEHCPAGARSWAWG